MAGVEQPAHADPWMSQSKDTRLFLLYNPSWVRAAALALGPSLCE